jgi:Sulfotransferase family
LNISGFFRVISPTEVRGWAFDADDPSVHLRVEVKCGDQVVGQANAQIYRPDLEKAGVGHGDHGFIVYCDPPIDAHRKPIAVYAVALGRPAQPLEEAPEPPLSSTPPEIINWPGISSDGEHHPVFILGSARSGTSAVTLALLTATQYEGYGEGHFFDFLAPLSVALGRYLPTKKAERGRNTTVSRISQSFLDDGLAAIAVAAARQLFPGGHWLDKTPNADMIHLAPRFRQIWPNARFIFMKRRGVDNVASRLRKFPYGFERNCREWAASMQAWLSVRDELHGVSVELDQATIMQESDRAAVQIGELLMLSAVEQHRVAQLLAHERPQQTGVKLSQGKPLEEMHWAPEQIEAFRRICGPMMAAYSYSE